MTINVLGEDGYSQWGGPARFAEIDGKLADQLITRAIKAKVWQIPPNRRFVIALIGKDKVVNVSLPKKLWKTGIAKGKEIVITRVDKDVYIYGDLKREIKEREQAAGRSVENASQSQEDKRSFPKREDCGNGRGRRYSDNEDRTDSPCEDSKKDTGELLK
ncbi:MAG: hypothetical protein LLG40_06795 [Deltaproteobacteria bacterium]|nr:hypothetical protein [Deltaproteobacteria bacterium]